MSWQKRRKIAKISKNEKKLTFFYVIPTMVCTTEIIGYLEMVTGHTGEPVFDEDEGWFLQDKVLVFGEPEEPDTTCFCGDIKNYITHLKKVLKTIQQQNIGFEGKFAFISGEIAGCLLIEFDGTNHTINGVGIDGKEQWQYISTI